MNLQNLFEQNPELLLNETSLRNVFHDIYKNDVGKSNLMVHAYSWLGMLDALQKPHPSLAHEKKQWTLKLQTEYYIPEDRAVWTVDQWTSLFSDTLAVKVSDAVSASEKKQRRINVL